MTQTAKKQRQYVGRIGRAEIAVIHVAKDQLGMEDDAYRELLGSFAVTSSKQLTRGQFRELMECFERAGFKRQVGAAEGSGAPTDSKARLLTKVGAQLADQDLPWSYADAIATRMFHRRCARWCSAEELSGIVAALYNRAKKAGGLNPPAPPADSGPQGERVSEDGELGRVEAGQ